METIADALQWLSQNFENTSLDILSELTICNKTASDTFSRPWGCTACLEDMNNLLEM
jgi:hypothetical protein